MQYSLLGSTGLRVSKLGLGGAFGKAADSKIVTIVHAAIDRGINMIDTAHAYFDSERRIGEALRGRRQQVILASKVGGKTSLSYGYEAVIDSVEESLRRLKTDCLDLIQLHSLETCGDRMAKEETLPAFHKLQEQGKVRFTGISGRRAEALAPFVQEGLVDTVQPFGTYTLIDHSAGADLFPEAREHGIGVIMASPLWMGILADTPAHFLCERHDLLAEAERRKAEIAFLRQHDGPGGLIEPAMRFCLSCPDIAVTLTGARSVLELEQNCSFCDGRGLGQQLEERILALFHGRGLQ